MPEVVVIKVASLDDPSWFRPMADIWMGSAQPWEPTDRASRSARRIRRARAELHPKYARTTSAAAAKPAASASSPAASAYR